MTLLNQSQTVYQNLRTSIVDRKRELSTDLFRNQIKQIQSQTQNLKEKDEIQVSFTFAPACESVPI